MRLTVQLTLVLVLIVSGVGVSAQERELTTNQELASYALGAQVAFSIRHQSEQFQMDPQAVAMGIEDVLSGRDLRYEPAQLQMAMANYQEEMKAKLGNVAEENLVKAVEFLTANQSKNGVIETDSGLQYKVYVEGEGASPAAGASVLVHYRGTLLDGTEFDSSYSRGEPIVLQSDQVIPAWQEALAMMKPGAKWELYVHPDLGYGEQGSGASIGPNAAMIFQVELLSVQ
jgi:FKBP-type peptidyl-prolyl cis-trans isomerase